MAGIMTLSRDTPLLVRKSRLLLRKRYQADSDRLFQEGLVFFALETVRVVGSLPFHFMNRLRNTLASKRTSPSELALLGASHGRLVFLHELGYPLNWQRDPPPVAPLACAASRRDLPRRA